MLDRIIWKSSRRFGFSTRSLGDVMFWFAGTAQGAGAGGRYKWTNIEVKEAM